MTVPAGKKFFIRIAHGIGAALAEHDLKINRLQTIIYVTVDNAGWAGNAFPRTKRAVNLPPRALVFEKNLQMPFEDKKYFLNFMGVRGISFAGIDEHYAERKGAALDNVWIIVFA